MTDVAGLWIAKFASETEDGKWPEGLARPRYENGAIRVDDLELGDVKRLAGLLRQAVKRVDAEIERQEQARESDRRGAEVEQARINELWVKARERIDREFPGED